MAVQKITKRLLESSPSAPGGRTYIWDSEVSGFGARCIGEGSWYFLLKYQREGRQTWIKLGAFGSELTVDQARKLARGKLAEVAKGEDLAARRVAPKTGRSVADAAQRVTVEQARPKLKPNTRRE